MTAAWTGPVRAHLLTRVFPSPKSKCESSPVLLLSLCCHGVSRRCKSRDFRVPPGKPASLAPDLEQDKGWKQLMSGELSVSWDCKKGLLPILEDTNFYCRVSTKASNSRTFFSCTASFCGSESRSSAMDCAPMSMERLLS